MKTIDTYTCDFPSYALCGLINADTSGMEEEDIENLTEFENEMEEMRERLGARSTSSELRCELIEPGRVAE